MHDFEISIAVDYRVETPSGERIVGIEIPREPFAVWLSGGFDSTLLLHLLCRENPEHISAYNVARGGGTDHYARLAASTVGKRYGVSICLTELEPIVGEAQEQIESPMDAFLRKGFVRKIVTGVTSNPPCLPNGPNRPTRVAPGYVLPFLHCDKSHVIALADQLGLLDEVALVSHTCTERDVAEESCRECWQCRERAWGFAQNGLTDPRFY